MAPPKGGKPHTTEAKEVEFRAKWLELGIVKRAAEAVGIPVSTGYDLAKRAEADSQFVRQREELRARVVPEVETRLLGLAEFIEERIREKDRTPEELAAIAVENNLKSFSYQNPKPQYFRGLVDLYGKLVAARKAGDAPDGAPLEVTVHLKSEPEPDASG